VVKACAVPNNMIMDVVSFGMSVDNESMLTLRETHCNSIDIG
jgi:hypothetical protein